MKPAALGAQGEGGDSGCVVQKDPRPVIGFQSLKEDVPFIVIQLTGAQSARINAGIHGDHPLQELFVGHLH